MKKGNVRVLAGAVVMGVVVAGAAWLLWWLARAPAGGGPLAREAGPEGSAAGGQRWRAQESLSEQDREALRAVLEKGRAASTARKSAAPGPD